MFYKKGVLKNFAKFTGKNLCLSLLGPRDLRGLRNKKPHCISFTTVFLVNKVGRVVTYHEGLQPIKSI